MKKKSLENENVCYNRKSIYLHKIIKYLSIDQLTRIFYELADITWLKFKEQNETDIKDELLFSI